MKDSARDIFRFFALIGATIIFVYLLPSIFAAAWFILLLVIYFRSNDEAFWLAFYFVISDGFAGFFGLYEATINILPGLPAIEVAQFYILLATIKAFLIKDSKWSPFYSPILRLLFIYIILLVLIGSIHGLKGINIHFRVIKLTFPLLLFYSMPKLLNSTDNYRRFFLFIFPVAILAFISQLFTVISGISPAAYAGFSETVLTESFVLESEIYRGFFNPGINLISFLGVQIYLSKKDKTFSTFYLQAILFSILGTALISATRGWIIGLGVSVFFFLALIYRIKSAHFFGLLVIVVISYLLINFNPKLQKQFELTQTRLLTVEALVEGDLTIHDTETRTKIRSPRVIKKWAESPFLGWGFSNEFFKYYDGHVGNQNILLHSGVVGALLMLSFFLYFHMKLESLRKKLSLRNSYKKSLLAFPIVFLGFFIIHSTSGQQFAYYALPGGAIILSVFYTFGGFCYYDAQKIENTI